MFFFQAEDGIRDIGVTGVQTCALPISNRPRKCCNPWSIRRGPRALKRATSRTPCSAMRSEERRVGKERRSRSGPARGKQQKGLEVGKVQAEYGRGTTRQTRRRSEWRKA